MKNDENERKNNEKWWKREKQKWKIMKKRRKNNEKWWKREEQNNEKWWKRDEKKQWKMMNNRETTMENDEQ